VSLREEWKAAVRVAAPLLPTLVFTLVLAEIVRDEAFPTPSWLFGALTIYAVVGTLIPGFMFGRAVPDPDLLTTSALAVPPVAADRTADGAEAAAGVSVTAAPQKTPAAAPPTHPPGSPPAPPAND
jgi:hypothetical protein